MKVLSLKELSFSSAGLNRTLSIKGKTWGTGTSAITLRSCQKGDQRKKKKKEKGCN